MKAARIKIAYEISIQRKENKKDPSETAERKIFWETLASFYLYTTSDTHKYGGIFKETWTGNDNTYGFREIIPRDRFLENVRTYVC